MQNTKDLPTDQSGLDTNNPGDATLSGAPGKIIKLIMLGLQTFLSVADVFSWGKPKQMSLPIKKVKKSVAK